MRKTMNISVSEEMHSFIQHRVRAGFHSSVSGYIRSLVRLDQAKSTEVTAAESKRYPTLRRANDVLAGRSATNERSTF